MTRYGVIRQILLVRIIDIEYGTARQASCAFLAIS